MYTVGEQERYEKFKKGMTWDWCHTQRDNLYISKDISRRLLGTAANGFRSLSREMHPSPKNVNIYKYLCRSWRDNIQEYRMVQRLWRYRNNQYNKPRAGAESADWDSPKVTAANTWNKGTNQRTLKGLDPNRLWWCFARKCASKYFSLRVRWYSCTRKMITVPSRLRTWLATPLNMDK